MVVSRCWLVSESKSVVDPIVRRDASPIFGAAALHLGGLKLASPAKRNRIFAARKMSDLCPFAVAADVFFAADHCNRLRPVGRCPVVVDATLPISRLCVKHENMLAAFYFDPYGQRMSKIMTHAMRAAGLNDVTLAALIGCSQSHINRIRNGKMVPRRVMANAIERALSVHGLADELTKKERDNA